MRIRALAGLTCLAVSLNAVVVDFATPNGEIQFSNRVVSIATDGSNILAATTVSNLVFVQLGSTNGTSTSVPQLVASNAYSPVIAFGAGAYFMVWSNDTTALWGRKLDLTGVPLSDAMQISGAGEAIGSHTVINAARDFVVGWDTVVPALSTNAVIRVRFVTGGNVLGNTRAITDTNTSNRFPTLSFDGTNILVAWCEQRSATGWAVVGSFIDREGYTASAMLTLSSTNAFAARKPSLAFSGTNHLVVWTREIGPYFYTNFDGYTYAPFTTNLFYPCLFGRVVSTGAAIGTNEITVARQKWGIEEPVVTLLDDDFFVAWRDLRRSSWQWRQTSNDPWVVALRCNLWGRAVRQDGSLKHAEFPIRWVDGSSEPLSATHTDGSAFIGYSGRVSAVSRANDPQPSFDWITLTSTSVITHVTTHSSYGYLMLQRSTNLVNWEDVGGIFTGSWQRATNGNYFYRLHLPTRNCMENLRMIEWAKSQLRVNDPLVTGPWVPVPSDIWGPGGPLAGTPVLSCPTFGIYTLNALDSKPTCNINGHSL